MIDYDDVVIEEPEQAAFERHPSDLFRLLVGVLVGVFGFLLATVFNEVGEAMTVEVIEIACDPTVIHVCLPAGER